MVQAINDNGLLSIVQLGGWHNTNIPAHTVYVKNREGELIKGITTSKPVHFMTASERCNNSLEIENIFVDVGASSRKEVLDVFNIRVRAPIAPKVEFDFNEKKGVCYGKAFDNSIKYQNAVRRGGSTNAAKISLTYEAVPVLVLGIPSRYVHSHYNCCAKEDIEASVSLAIEVIKSLTEEVVNNILRK